MVILNFNRPDNVRNILKAVKDYKCIDEIILSNGKKETSIEGPQHPKIKFRSDYIINDVFGLELRFIAGMYAKNPNLIMMDDDILMSEENLDRLIKIYETDPHRVVGIYGRKTHNNEYMPQNIHGLVDIVLTRIMILPRRLCSIYFTVKPIVADVFEEGKPRGNGEDILLSYTSLYYHRQKNYSVPIQVKNLCNKQAISSNPDHYSYRSKLCRELHKKRHMLEYLIRSIPDVS